jgi:hypothetical protein
LSGTAIEFPSEMSLLPRRGVFELGHNDGAAQSNSST